MKVIDENLLKNAVANSLNLTGVMRELKRADSSAGRNTIKKYIVLYNINFNHFETNEDRCKRISPNKKKRTINDIFVENSTYNGGVNLKKRLYDEGLKERKCELCGQDEIWNGKHMSLILDHINGIHDDNRIENLQIVCPNCNATLPTHCRGASKLITKEKKIRNSNFDLNISYIEKKKKKKSYGLGKSNSQFGTCWITNSIENKKIKLFELNTYLVLGWVRGRKLK